MKFGHRLRNQALFALLLLLFAEPFRCGGPIPQAKAAQFPPAIVIVEGKTAQGFSYLSGGVSSDEREIMEERGKSHNVKLVFAEKSGAYLAYIKLVIRDAKQQEIITLRETGPWFYIQLPPGTYRVQASAVGRSQEQALRVAKDKKTFRVFVWDLG